MKRTVDDWIVTPALILGVLLAGAVALVFVWVLIMTLALPVLLVYLLGVTIACLSPFKVSTR